MHYVQAPAASTSSQHVGREIVLNRHLLPGLDDRSGFVARMVQAGVLPHGCQRERERERDQIDESGSVLCE